MARKKSWREKAIREYQREEESRRLAQLRADLAKAKRDRVAAIAKARKLCRSERARLKQAKRQQRERIKAEREKLARESKRLTERYRRARDVAREVCGARVAYAEKHGSKAQQKAARELREYRATLRRLRERQREQRATAKQARERRRESDDEVRANIDPTLAHVFEARKHRVKGGPRKTRTEEFLEWAEENPEEVVAIQAQAGELAAELDIAELQRREREIQREIDRASRGRRRRASGDDVPF